MSSCETQPQSCRYVFPAGGTSWMVTTVDPLVVLNCSMSFPSTEFSSALGSWKLFSEAGVEVDMLPDTEFTGIAVSGTLLWTVDCDVFGRGLELPLTPRIRDACVRLGGLRQSHVTMQIFNKKVCWESNFGNENGSNHKVPF